MLISNSAYQVLSQFLHVNEVFICTENKSREGFFRQRSQISLVQNLGLDTCIVVSVELYKHHHLVQIEFRVQIEVKELLELGNVVASNRNPILLAVVCQICDSVKRVLLQTILEVLLQKFAINWAKSNYGL